MKILKKCEVHFIQMHKKCEDDCSALLCIEGRGGGDLSLAFDMLGYRKKIHHKL